MYRKDFLEGLRCYLESELSGEEVREHLNYYERYITEEVIKGKREEEVVQELGDPWVIAKTIIDMKENTSEYESNSSSNSSYAYEENRDYGRVRTVKFDSFLKKMLLLVGIAAFIGLVFSLVTGLISLVAPILLPVLVVMMIYRLFRRRV